jgi:biotin carboxyl carrier protein
VVPAGGSLSIRIGARIFDLMLEGTPPVLGVVGDGKRFYAQAESERARALAAASRKRGAGAGDAMITSPMPGRVLKVLVAEGDEVAVGQSVVVVEAMKMENELKSPKAGKVTEVQAKEGSTVENGAPLIVVE